MRADGRSTVVWILMAGVLVAPVLAQGGGAPGQRAESLRFQRGGKVPARAVSEEEKREILETIAGQLRDGYVFEEKGTEFAAKIESDLEAGAFDEFDRLDLFVGELTPYLYSMSHDKHLRVWGTGVARAARVAATAGADAGHQAAPQQRRMRPSGNTPGSSHGFASYERLDGNIGYIDLRGFSGDPASKPGADEAMMALEGVDAVVLDLRQNRGGAPFMVRYLSGFFFAESTHLASTMMRGMEAPRERWTLQDGRPTDGFVDTPLYVLTSGGTFSAAESFTFGLKINDRITQVGERTGGGGHWGETVPVGDGIEMFLPTGRTFDPDTGLGWEAEGLQPDIEVPANEALGAAIEAIRAS